MKRRRKKKQRMRLPLIIIIGIILFMGSFYNTYNANTLNPDESNESVNPLEWFNKSKERKNILVFGVDSSDKNTTNTRSDSIMFITIDANKEKPAIISIPRDTRVKIPGRDNFTKINHSYAYGGAELLVETVELLLDVDIDYYIGVNYNAVIQVVDTLGGIEVDVPMDMKYSDPYDDPPLNIDIKKGIQTLNGEEAMQFLRFRKGYAMQDLGRVEAQQQFVKALANKALSPSMIIKAPKLLNIVYNNINTDMPKNKMISLGFSSIGIDIETLNTLTLPGVPQTINGISYYVTSDDHILQVKSDYLND